MTIIGTTLDNFWQSDTLSAVFQEYSNGYEFTPSGIFRRITPPLCPVCGNWMVHNGYNEHPKKGLGTARIRRYLCQYCKWSQEEERVFWERIKEELFSELVKLYQLLRFNNLSYDGISSVMDFISYFQGVKTRSTMPSVLQLSKLMSHRLRV